MRVDKKEQTNMSFSYQNTYKMMYVKIILLSSINNTPNTKLIKRSRSRRIGADRQKSTSFPLLNLG